MTFLAHRGLARFVLVVAPPGRLHRGGRGALRQDGRAPHLGALFLSIFPILLIYGVGLTNTVESFMVNQLGLASRIG
jgi:serine transporter